MKIALVAGFTIWLALSAFAKEPFTQTDVLIVAIPDGASFTQSVTIATFGKPGLVSFIRDWDLDGDGAMDDRSQSFTTYGSHGERVLIESQQLALPDGVIQQRGTISFIYDRKGNCTDVWTRSDFDADGSIDFLSHAVLSYDSHGRLTTQRFEVDHSADGTVDEVTTYTYTYDARGNLLSLLRESDAGADGSPDLIMRTRNTLDSSGNVVLSVMDVEYIGDPSIRWSERTQSTFDKHGNRATSVTEHANETGIVEALVRNYYSYERDRLVEIVEESDWQNDGVVDEVKVMTRTYSR